jgi:hypothetical protein
MKNVLAVFISIPLLVAIWYASAFIIHILAFNAPMIGDSIIAEYLNKAATWFVAPGIGGYYSLVVINRFMTGIDIRVIFVSLVTVLVIVWLVMIAFFFFGKMEGATFGVLVQLILQGLSIFIGLKIVESKLNQDNVEV